MHLITDELDEKRLSSRAFLGIRQTVLPPGILEAHLGRWAEQGYLLVSVAADVAGHGDGQFLRTRPMLPKPMPASAFCQRNAAFHGWLCDRNQPHLPIRLGPDQAAPAALGWLVPAPREGTVNANGFEQPWAFDASLRTQWLLGWAEQIGKQQHPAQRLLVQMPGTDAPAYWHHGTYLGDRALPGTPAERIRMLLGTVPRYAPDGAGEPVPATPEAAGTWPLLVNESPATWGLGVVRSRDHLEILPLDEGYEASRSRKTP